MSYRTVPAEKQIGITPHDTNLIEDANGPVRTRAIYIGGNGNLTIINHEGNSITFTSVVAGSVLVIETQRVMATGTTATGLVGLY